MSHFYNKLLAFAFFSSIFLFFLLNLISKMSTKFFPGGVCLDCPAGKDSRNRARGPLRVHPRLPPHHARNLCPRLLQRAAPLSVYSSLFARHCLRAPSSSVPLPTLSKRWGFVRAQRPTHDSLCLFPSKKATFQELLLLASFSKPRGPFPALSRRSLSPAPAPLPTRVRGVPDPEKASRSPTAYARTTATVFPSSHFLKK